MNQVEVLSIYIQAGLPTMILSIPGRGKTRIVQAVCRKLDMPCLTFTLSIREAVDVAGLPYASEDRETLRYLPIQQLYELSKTGGVLFLDELTSANPEVQAAALRLVDERMAGELHLGEHVRIVAAGNPPELAANGMRLAAALANRFVFIPEWALDFDAWTRYMVSEIPDSSQVDTLTLDENWRAARPDWAALISGYLKARPDHWSPTPSPGRMAYPSPRTWDRMAFALAAIEASGGDWGDYQQTAEGVAGDEGVEFTTWAKNQDLPPVRDVLRDPERFLPEDALLAWVSFTSVINTAPPLPKVFKVIKILTERRQRDVVAAYLKDVIKRAIDEGTKLPDWLVQQYHQFAEGVE